MDLPASASKISSESSVDAENSPSTQPFRIESVTPGLRQVCRRQQQGGFITSKHYIYNLRGNSSWSSRRTVHLPIQCVFHVEGIPAALQIKKRFWIGTRTSSQIISHYFQLAFRIVVIIEKPEVCAGIPVKLSLWAKMIFIFCNFKLLCEETQTLENALNICVLQTKNKF